MDHRHPLGTEIARQLTLLEPVPLPPVHGVDRADDTVKAWRRRERPASSLPVDENDELKVRIDCGQALEKALGVCLGASHHAWKKIEQVEPNDHPGSHPPPKRANTRSDGTDAWHGTAQTT
jgi:hypothetical protein